MDELREIVTKELQKKVDEMVADAMIREMQEANLSPDDMLRVIAMAKEKFIQMKKQKHGTLPTANSAKKA